MKTVQHDFQQRELERRKRARFFYRGLLVSSFGAVVYLVFALHALILPLIIGALLAYLFRPFLNQMKVSWLPNGVRVCLLLTLLIGTLALAALQISKKIPSEEEWLILQVRSQYKLNEKYRDWMGISERHPKGNILNNLIGSELEPLLEKLNHTLQLDTIEEATFLEYIAGRADEKPEYERYQSYHAHNKTRGPASHTSIRPSEGESPNPETESAATDAPRESGDGGRLVALASALSIWFIMPLVFIFLLFDKGQIIRSFVRWVPNTYFEMSLTIIDEVDQAIGRYLRGTLLECGLVGAVHMIGFYLVGMDPGMAVLIGVVAGVANAIPFLGPFIGFVAGVFYALIAENVNPVLPFLTADHILIGVMVTVAVAQLLDNAVFQPLVLGSAVNLHPLLVILGVLGGSLIFGFAGMLLAIPTIVVIKVILETLVRELKAYRII